MRAFFLQTVGAILLGASMGLFVRWTAAFKRAGPILFLACQLGLIYACDFAQLPGLVVVLVLLGGYAALLRLERIGEPVYRSPAWFFFAAYLAYWLIEKYLLPLGVDAWLLSGMPGLAAGVNGARAIAIVGISYIGFKFITFVVDYRDGQIKDVDPIEFLSWLLFFPSIVAGPMQRFQDWQAQRAVARFNVADVAMGLRRLIGGMFMKFVLADTIHGATIAKMSTGALSDASFWELARAAVCYTLYLYWDFAGYSSMAIGIGLFWGVRLPENFRAPFLARNLAEFWRRWHISLSDILRDYLFYPLSLRVKRIALLRPHQNIAAAIPPVITFLFAGIWHGATLGFLLYGLMQGIGLAYLAIRKRRKPATRVGRWWAVSRTGHVFGAAFNFAYFTCSLVFFCLPTESLALLWTRLVT